MSPITRNGKEYRSMTVQLMSQNLPSKRFLRLFYVFLTISYLQTRTIETSRFFLAYWLYILTVISTFLNMRASYWSDSSGFRPAAGQQFGSNSKWYKLERTWGMWLRFYVCNPLPWPTIRRHPGKKEMKRKWWKKKPWAIEKKKIDRWMDTKLLKNLHCELNSLAPPSIFGFWISVWALREIWLSLWNL